MNSIVALTGLELECTSLDKAVDWYVRLFGLKVSSSEASRVSLKGGRGHSQQVTLIAGNRNRLIGLGFELNPAEDPRRYARALDERGVSVLQGSDTGVSFHDPDGTAITVSRSPGWEPGDTRPEANRPLYLSHVVLNSPDPHRLVSFYTDKLGFQISDQYERNLLTLLRCHQPQHHCLGVSPANYSGLNHFAMECGTIDAVMTGVGRMKRAGIEPIWGPGRHGPGGNVFCYFDDPNGFVAEFTCELISIPEDCRWQAKEWARTPENANVWGTGAPTPRALKLMNDNPPPG
jgi:catechol 2,3-dioxygenase-like lactoylglutathione lyase family enzyme